MAAFEVGPIKEKVMLDLDDLVALRKLVGDMRFLQATVTVGNGTHKLMVVTNYLTELSCLQEKLEQEIKRRSTDSEQDSTRIVECRTTSSLTQEVLDHDSGNTPAVRVRGGTRG